MQQEKLNNKIKSNNYSFTIVPDYFFRKLIKVMGAIPSLVYLTLLSYCHKKKYVAWPSLNTMSKETGLAKTTIIRNLNILIKQNFIKNIAKDKSLKNYYHHNVYQIFPPEKKIVQVMVAERYHRSFKMLPVMVAERYPNNNNLNNNNITTTNGENVAVDFKKLREKGEEKMQAIREQLRDLDFEEEFIEQLLKDYPARNIEEKLDLLLIKRNIQNPAGWLKSALKKDYRGEEQEGYDEEPAEGSGDDISTSEQVSREKALEAIKLIQKNLSACISPLPSGKRARFRENVGIR